VPPNEPRVEPKAPPGEIHRERTKTAEPAVIARPSPPSAPAPAAVKVEAKPDPPTTKSK
jgi:hypothetical protein